MGIVLGGCSTLFPTATNGEKSYEHKLTEHLIQEGVTMYGAFWCPHCEAQKELFGPALDSVPYVECDPGGESPQPQLCQDKGIQGYPTWEIDGEFHPGVRSLEELATLTGFPLPTP
ncbi:glutaredoxin family protein [Leptolyngbya sp. PCC 6406]|uniref:glutaredoxin family protein n=1 Tax=Leptolyngbya sp. PCC 6406 TaxID=1173264 RepID=UPI0012DF8BF9|nr:hypothetical protein [Leptolyngbya sp. PCC 6406]